VTTSSRKRSVKQERAAAKKLDGRTTPNSGAGWAVKNDVKTDRFSIEYKFTDKKSFSLKLDDLLKAETQALLDGGRESAFVVEFSIAGREFLIIDASHGQELLRGHSE
jgi:hypothetical protein